MRLCAAFLAIGVNLVKADSQVQTVDLYRAMTKPQDGKETLPVSNNNLADVLGVLRYVHQEVIVEHVAGNPERETRKYDIDAFAHYRMKIRNPDTILKDPSKMAIPGFGGFGAFDFGVATSLDLLEQLVSSGDFVGISKQDSPQINFTHPWYWFSVDGDCPNLPWTCVKPYPGCQEKAPPTMPQPCDPDGCAGKKDQDARSCTDKPQFTDPTDTETARKCCLHYSQHPDQVIIGGLCNSSVKEPTGEIGCVYQYEALTSKDFLPLDDLNGINSMPCGADGKRKCSGWKDWRDHCYDPEGKYKKRFHCEDPRCMALKPEEKEYGLPFWSGKCTVSGNQLRAEAVASYFLGDPVRNSHWLVDPAAMDASPGCASKDIATPNQCTPNPDGGPYCTRVFGGVCSTCYIPGTSPAYPDPQSQPMCPFGVLKEKGNTPPTETKCSSSDPLNLCCLYGLGSCEVNGTDGSDAELTARGFMQVMRLMDNKEMVKFASRYVSERGGAIKNEGGFDAEIYSTWHYQPPSNPEQAWDGFEEQINKSSAVDWHPSPAPAPVKGGSSAVWWVLIILVVLAALGFAGYKYYSRSQQQARQQLLPSDNRQVQMSG